jgi:hypothetical protein
MNFSGKLNLATFVREQLSGNVPKRPLGYVSNCGKCRCSCCPVSGS